VRAFSGRSLWAALLTVLGGCAEEWGRTPIAGVEVSGRVREGARPISGGWIEFIPVDGAVGHLRSAPLHEDGTFQATRLGLGPHVVRLVRPASPGVDPIFQQFTSPLRVVVEPGARVDIDLARERRRLQAGGAS